MPFSDSAPRSHRVRLPASVGLSIPFVLSSSSRGTPLENADLTRRRGAVKKIEDVLFSIALPPLFCGRFFGRTIGAER